MMIGLVLLIVLFFDIVDGIGFGDCWVMFVICIVWLVVEGVWFVG